MRSNVLVGIRQFTKCKMVIWYDCPRCGLENSSDGEHFCGGCERKYAQEQEGYQEMLDEYNRDRG